MLAESGPRTQLNPPVTPTHCLTKTTVKEGPHNLESAYNPGNSCHIFSRRTKKGKYFMVRLSNTNQTLLLIPCQNQVVSKGICLALCSFPLPRSLLRSPNFAVLTLGN